ncbi:hypothetical protein CFO_g3123 [Ceratocystis platani]|uniref:Nephrocystin 3-like N-terminal domain-containing protein n=1 Tax=Ceratocystis fimbriata f. sp. platani TaxID=88771 RepID=A0A0F8B0N7_CERFI|nr:hypothetical protein CFO_g3123 [Ceratocystis platani]
MSHRLKGPLPDPKNKSNELAEREREEKCTQDANRIQDLIETLKTGTAASIIESIGRFALKFMHFNQCLLDLLTQTVKLFEPLNAIIKTNREFESQTPKTIDAKSPDIKTPDNKPSEIKTIDIKSQVEDRNWVELYDTCLNRLRDLWTDIISKIAPSPTSKMVKTSIWAPFEEWKEALENIHADFIKISNFHSVEVLMNTYQLTKDLGRNIDRLKDLVETNSNQLYQYLEIDSHNPYAGYSPSESRKVLNWLLGEAKDVFPSLDANSITVKSGQQAPPQPKAAGPRAKKILILSGDSSCGKSWALEGLINHLKDKKFRVFSYFRDNSDTRPFDVAHITKALLYRYLSHNSNQAEFFGQLKQGDGKLPESQINHKFIWSKLAQSLALRPGKIVFAIDYAKKNKSSFTSEDWKSISDIIKPFLSSDTRFIFTTRRFPQETPNIEALNQLAVVVDVASKNKQERKAFIKGKWDELKKVGKSLSEAKQKEFRHLLGENSKGDYSKITDFFNMLHKSPYFNQERIESAIRDLGGNRLKIVDTMRNCSHTNRMSDVKFMIAWLTCAFVPSLKVTTFALFRSLTPTQSLQSNTAISERLKEYDLIFQHDPDSDCLTWQVGASCQSFTLADSFRQTKIPCNAAMYDMHDKLILGIKEAFKTDPHPANLIEKAVNEAFNDPTIRNDHDDNLRIAVYCLRVLTRLYDSKQNLRPRFRRGKNAMEHQGFDGEDESIGASTAAVSTLRSPDGKQAVKQILPPIVTLSKFCQSKTHWPQSHCSYEEIKLWMTNTIAGGIEKLPPSALLQGMEQFLWYCVFIPYSDSGSTQGPSLSPESIKRCADYILDRWCTVSAARRLLLIPQSEMSVRIHDDMFQKINRKWAHDQSEKTKEQWLSRADDFVYGILGQEHLRPRLVKLCIGNKDARDVIETLVRHVFDKSNMYGMEVRLKASIGFASIIGLYSNTLSTMRDSVNWLFAALDPKSDLLQKSQKLAKYLKAQRHDNVDLVLKLLTRISRYMDTRSNGEQYAASSFNKLKATLRSVCCDDHAEVMVATNAFHIDPKNDTAFYPKPTEVFITKRLSNLGGPGTQSPLKSPSGKTLLKQSYQ